MIRRRVKIGDYLARDDESGRVHFASEMVELWDGRLVHKNGYETRQPQEFVRAKSDPLSLTTVRDVEDVPVPFTGAEIYIGNTTVPVPQGAAYHLFDLGIGSMRVGKSFVVRGAS